MPRGQGSVSNERVEPAGCGNQKGFSTVSVILPFTAKTLLLPRWHYPPRVRSYRESVATEIVGAPLEAHTSLSRRAIWWFVLNRPLPNCAYIRVHEYTGRGACVLCEHKGTWSDGVRSTCVGACVYERGYAGVCMRDSIESPLLPLTAANAVHSRTTTLTSLTSWTCLLLSCDPRVRVYVGLTTVLPHSCLTLLLLDPLFIRPSRLRSYVTAHGFYRFGHIVLLCATLTS